MASGNDNVGSGPAETEVYPWAREGVARVWETDLFTRPDELLSEAEYRKQWTERVALMVSQEYRRHRERGGLP